MFAGPCPATAARAEPAQISGLPAVPPDQCNDLLHRPLELNTIQIRDCGSARPWPPWPGRAGRRDLVLIGAVISRPEIRAGSTLAAVPGPGEQQLRITKREGKATSTEPTTGLQNADHKKIVVLFTVRCRDLEA